MNSRILVELNKDKRKIEITGSKISIMSALAELSEALLKKSNLTKEDIKLAIDLGTKSEKEKQEIENKLDKELEENLKKLLKKIFN